MATYIDALDGKHTDGSEYEFSTTSFNNIKKLEVGYYVVLYSLQELKEKGFEINGDLDDAEIPFENVDIPLSVFEDDSLFKDHAHRVKEIDEDFDFKIMGYYLTFPYEMIKEVYSEASNESLIYPKNKKDQ